MRPPRVLKLQPTGVFGNGPHRRYEWLDIKPLAAAMGAEVRGVSLRSLADDSAFQELREALWHHKMLYFRDQELSHADQEAFTLRFGDDFGTDAYTKGVSDEHPNVQPVVREATTTSKIVFGEGWHTDSPFLARPPAYSVLRQLEGPEWGGDTIFANAELAYDCLSDTMKQLLAPLKVHMSAAAVVATMEALSSGNKLGDLAVDLNDARRRAMVDGAYHPLVRTHPETQRKALYVDETYTHGIQGLHHHEASPLIAFLQAHVTNLSFTARLRWAPNTLAIWDNRSCLHHAFNDHDGARRLMFRTTVQGEVPV